MPEKTHYNMPDDSGHFGTFGGCFVAETLIPAIDELNHAYKTYVPSEQFQKEFYEDLKFYVGRPTPLYHAKRLSMHLNGAQIYLKREDLNHTGAHKITHATGQALLAKRMNKTRIIAETGAGQHGVATATVCARLGLECVIYMGEKDIHRQSANVYRMKLLGAKVIPVTAGSKTLKDAVNAALRDWVTNVDNTYYLLGTALGPRPYPEMVRNFQIIVGTEVKVQSMKYYKKLPNALVACVGGGSNAIGLFYPFLNNHNVKMYGVEAGGLGDTTSKHACRLSIEGKKGVLHGNRTYIMSDDAGNIQESHSVSAGLDYPGVGPEHSWLKDIKRVQYTNVLDNEALEAFRLLSSIEGIIPALESSHALAYAQKLSQQMNKDEMIVVNLSGRGDKDINTVAAIDNIKL